MFNLIKTENKNFAHFVKQLEFGKNIYGISYCFLKNVLLVKQYDFPISILVAIKFELYCIRNLEFNVKY